MRFLGRAADGPGIGPVHLSLQLAAGGSASADTQWSGTLTQAIDHVPVATEVRTGYDRDLFHLWIDADGDGCNTRAEVLIAEAEDPADGRLRLLTVGRPLVLLLRRASRRPSASALDIDHMVPLAEAWDSGADLVDGVQA